jgi:hypothetical protein
MFRRTPRPVAPTTDADPIAARYYVVPAVVWGGILAALMLAAHFDNPANPEASAWTPPAHVLPVAA